MVWINTECHNASVPDGVFGGSMCVCPSCRLNRLQESIDQSKPLDKDIKKKIEDLEMAIKLWPNRTDQLKLNMKKRFPSDE